jgi:DNA-binding LytR/AlgR family response regulator
MDIINCMIVDDEPLAREIIVNYCDHLAFLKVTSICSNAIEAKNILQQQPIDILFLDINMPVLDGIGLAKTLKNKPQIIFTTAYKEYAVSAFELSVCDYLVKPFSLERFIVAVDKAVEHLKAVSKNILPSLESERDDFVIIKTDGKIYKLQYDEILYVEAKGNYTKVVTDKNTLMPVMPLSGLEILLPKTFFIRVHRSFIINKSKLSHIEGNQVFIQKKGLPIGSNYKEQFFKTLGI